MMQYEEYLNIRPSKNYRFAASSIEALTSTIVVDTIILTERVPVVSDIHNLKGEVSL
jgi:hypothetical protein